MARVKFSIARFEISFRTARSRARNSNLSGLRKERSGF